MSYDTIADAVLTLVRAYDNGATYTKANSSIENWKVLDARGIALSAIVAQFGDSQEGPSLDGHAQQGYWQEHHEIGIIVAYKVKTEDDARSIDALHAAVQELRCTSAAIRAWGPSQASSMPMWCARRGAGQSPRSRHRSAQPTGVKRLCSIS
jgi:hypothetical protein